MSEPTFVSETTALTQTAVTSVSRTISETQLLREPARGPGGTANAWLLPIGRGTTVAVGSAELAHVLSVGEVRLQRLPCTPDYCAHVMLWNETPLPVVDIAARARAGVDSLLDETIDQRLFGLVHYALRSAPARVELGAVVLEDVPRRFVVSDAMACEPAEEHRAFERFTLACFRGPEERPTPVVDLARLFAGE